MDTKQFIAEHLNDDVRELALKYSNAKVDMALALRQIEARQILRKKVPSWSDNEDLLFPAHLSIEQCSSEDTARYKASLLQGQTFVDLTGGLGVDCFFISQNFQHTDYVEQNAELCALAEHNLSNPLIIHNESAEEYLTHCSPVDVIFLDPARRDAHGRKTVSIADCTPNVLELQNLLLQKARLVMLKLSPMLDISKALKELHCVQEVHVVAVANECKELLFLLEPDFEGEPTFTCVNLQTDQPSVRFTAEEEHSCHAAFNEVVSRYLYEPNAALMKGGCFKLLTQRYGVQKLHRNSHLYTSDRLIHDFPGRVFMVEGWASFNKKIRQTLLSGVKKASIATRNFPLSVAELRKTLKIADGDELFLFATTLTGEQKVIISARKAK
ncbi:MAG: SAM-dependent methyltransferase [Bacteroidales bacterium]|nr:SAM-dependent methyltransferase [Bacteroidales bacterium]